MTQVVAIIGVGLLLIVAAVMMFFYLAYMTVAFGRTVRFIWRSWDGNGPDSPSLHNPHPRHVPRPPDPNGG